MVHLLAISCYWLLVRVNILSFSLCLEITWKYKSILLEKLRLLLFVPPSIDRWTMFTNNSSSSGTVIMQGHLYQSVRANEAGDDNCQYVLTTINLIVRPIKRSSSCWTDPHVHNIKDWTTLSPTLWNHHALAIVLCSGMSGCPSVFLHEQLTRMLSPSTMFRSCHCLSFAASGSRPCSVSHHHV